jgi:5'-methylthioadenosine phosphorylase
MKQKICLIGGSGLMSSDIFKNFKPVKIKNKYGRVVIFRRGDIFFINRHQGNLPPHRINFKAYFKAIVDLDINKIISFNSVGSLKKGIKVPSFLIPHDFICLSGNQTFFDDEIIHTTPIFSKELRRLLIKTCSQINLPIYKKGVYLQTAGPRFETAAEIKMFSKFADVVGMTLASEVILAGEIGVPIAAISSIDNYSNGVSGHSDYKKGAENNLKIVEIIVKNILCRL